MKIYLIFFVTFSLLKLQSGYLIGERVSGDINLHTYSVQQKGGQKDFEGYIWGIGATKGTRVDKVLNINLDQLSGIDEDIKITRILATSSSRKDSEYANADLKVIDGGLGKRQIRLKFTSQRGYGFNYSVRVYGTDFRTLPRRFFNRWKDAIDNTKYKDLVKDVRYNDYQLKSDRVGGSSGPDDHDFWENLNIVK